MKVGDRVVVIADDEYSGCEGHISGWTKDGLAIVQLEGIRSPHWMITIHPQEIELAARVPLYWQVGRWAV